MSRLDPHSYFDSTQPRARRLRLKLAVDFQERRLSGTVVLELAAPSSGPLDLDTKGLEIRSVRAAGGGAVPFALQDEEAILGRRLRLDLPSGTREVAIDYRTSPEAIALQWLSPEQTEGKRHPFLFSQCQAIHARTMVPVQDSPRVRVAYAAEITVRAPLAAVMSAGPAGDRPGAAVARPEVPDRQRQEVGGDRLGHLEQEGAGLRRRPRPLPRRPGRHDRRERRSDRDLRRVCHADARAVLHGHHRPGVDRLALAEEERVPFPFRLLGREPLQGDGLGGRPVLDGDLARP